MSVQSHVPGEDIADALQSLGARFLLGGEERSPGLTPTRLICALAQSEEARLRLALIPLFLERPDFAAHARRAAGRLPEPARFTLQCYYTAAMLLQDLHRAEIAEQLGGQAVLPDLFSQDLLVPKSGAPGSRLEALARRHQVLSGDNASWLGTYWRAAQSWLKGLKFAQYPE